MIYSVRIKNSQESIDIGEFPNIEEARNWAIVRYGSDLDSVTPVYTTEAKALDPAWILLGIVLLIAFTKKKGGA